MNHRDRLCEVAEKNGLPPLSGAQTPLDYISYALDLICVETGILDPRKVKKDRREVALRQKKERRSWLKRYLP